MASIGTDRELVRRGGLAAFVRAAWHIVEPARPLKWNWHMQIMADHYQAVSRGELKRLVMNVPPGTSKTLTTCVFWNAWDWIEHPGRGFMYLCYSDEKAHESAYMTTNLVSSEWYQERWGERVGQIVAGDRAAKGLFYTTKGGKRMSTMMGGAATGFHADIQVCDDPNKAQDLELGGDSAREKMQLSVTRWEGTLSSRHNDSTEFARVVIMQRLHESDLAGHCIENGYQACVLPMEFEPENAYVSPWGSDPRTQEGELLAPDRFPPHIIAEKKKTMTAMDYAAQMQQRPSPAEGAIFKIQQFSQRWEVVPPGLSKMLISVDATFKETKKSDFFVAQAWAMQGAARFVLLDQFRERTGLHGGIEAIRRMRAQWGATSVIVEDKANGSAVIETLSASMPGVIAINPKGGKDARANAVEPLLRAMNCWFPSDRIAPWMRGYVANMIGFPMARYDDEVDCSTQALLHLSSRHRKSRWRTAMETARKTYGVR